MEESKKIVAENISKLRSAQGLTQAQLAEALHYSDKSVSKWERGESIPDVFVLKKIADMSGVTVDYLLSEHKELPRPPAEETKKEYSRPFITLTVLAGILALAVTTFVILWLAGIISWLVFLCAVPVALITTLILNSVWGNRTWNLYIVSALMWSLVTLAYFVTIENNWWQIFLMGIPAQIIIIFAFLIRGKPTP